ncbi:prepilin peptidase [Paludifilum halophilum]|uniref:prepilin peptidase n=1 Tax=Paludifilum halophilum TaxID=1642702 RepID=UPI00146C5BB9|nr:A24 family peptidase [Paludifilum halophilum]
MARFTVSQLVENPVFPRFNSVFFQGAVAAAFLLVFGLEESGTDRVIGWFFILFLATAVLTDLAYGLIPDRLTIPGGFFFLAVRLLFGETTLLSYPAGWLIGGAVLWTVARLSRGGMGGGDVKLAAASGGCLGWPDIAAGLVVSVFAGGLFAVFLWVSGAVGRRTALPFGPFLAVGFLTAWAWAEELIRWYLSFFP